jgi:hypothetical protein
MVCRPKQFGGLGVHDLQKFGRGKEHTTPRRSSRSDTGEPLEAPPVNLSADRPSAAAAGQAAVAAALASEGRAGRDRGGRGERLGAGGRRDAGAAAPGFSGGDGELGAVRCGPHARRAPRSAVAAFLGGFAVLGAEQRARALALELGGGGSGALAPGSEEMALCRPLACDGVWGCSGGAWRLSRHGSGASVSRSTVGIHLGRQGARMPGRRSRAERWCGVELTE